MPPSLEGLPFYDPAFVAVHLPALAILAACLGSFFNVCIYRIPLGVPLSFPGSHCYRCGQPVRWYDNIPLLSYWILGGRCRDCRAPFSMRYFLIELLTVALLMGATVRIGYSLALIPAWIFISLLIIGAFTDIDHWIIPDRVTLGGLAVGVALAAIPALGNAPGNPLHLAPGSLVRDLLQAVPVAWLPLADSLLGAAMGWGLLWSIGIVGSLIFRKDAMGLGDVKLFAMFGAFCGIAELLPLLMISSVIGTLVGLAMILRARLARGAAPDPAVAPLALAPAEQTALLAAHPLGAEELEVDAYALANPGAVGAVRHHLPFGPSLAVAAFVVFLWGEPLIQWAFRLVESTQGGAW